MTIQYNPFSLDGKLVLVTGASSGIGRQCAISCSQVGATVALFGRDRKRLKETVELMHESDKHKICVVDLLEYEKVADIVKEIVSQKGRCHGIINCAGISTTLPINTISTQMMEHFFNTNVIASVNITKQVVKSFHFSKNGGSIIFISSIMGVAGESGKTIYSMTKGAIISAVKSMSVELAPRGIRVNSISPGVVETPMSKNAVYSKDVGSLNRIRSLHPLGFGKPEDVAYACIFLLSDAANWVTGTNLIVDGGYLAK